MRGAATADNGVADGGQLLGICETGNVLAHDTADDITGGRSLGDVTACGRNPTNISAESKVAPPRSPPNSVYCGGSVKWCDPMEAKVGAGKEGVGRKWRYNLLG